MAEAKYLWELPVLSEIVDDNAFLAAENANPVAYQTNASSVKQYCNTEIVCEDPIAIFSDIVQAKLIADGSDGYIVEFTGDVALIATFVAGTKIQKDDGTIFCISDKFDSNPNLAVAIVETLGTDPLIFSNIYYTHSALVVNSDNYISTPKVLSNEIYTKTHIIDSINEAASQKYNIGREESVSNVTGDYLQTSNSKYRSLNSVGFKDYRKVARSVSGGYGLSPAPYDNPTILPLAIFNIGYLKNIGGSITNTNSSFKFSQVGIYTFLVRLFFRTDVSPSAFNLFMLDNATKQESVTKFIALVGTIKNPIVDQIILMNNSFSIVVTENELLNEYTFYYTSTDWYYVGGSAQIWTGHDVGYCNAIEIEKVQ
jgi:hypothetical protein